MALVPGAGPMAAQGVTPPPQGAPERLVPPPAARQTAGVIQSEPPIQRFEIRRPIVRIAQDYTVRAGDEVHDVTVVFGSVTVEGHVRGDLVVVFGDATLASTAVVDGSAVVVAGDVIVGDGAAVRGDMVVVGGGTDAPATFSPRGEHVVIGIPGVGQSLRGLVPWVLRGLLLGRPIVPDLGWVWLVVAVVFFVSLLTNLLFDAAVRSCATTVRERPLGTLLTGLIVLMLLGPLTVIVAATVVGIVALPFVMAAVAVAWLIGKVGVTRGLGASLVNQTDALSRGQGARSFLIGFAVLCIAYMVPILGILAWAMVGVFGLGAATMTFLTALRRESPRKAPPAAAFEPGEPPPSSGPATGQPPRAFEIDEPAGGVDVSAEPRAPGATTLFEEMPAAATSTETPFAPSEPASAFAHAPPAPATPAPPDATAAGRPYATFLDRVAAFALDCVLLAIATSLLFFTRGGGSYFLLLLVYHIAFWTWKGTTLGGIVVGIRIVRTSGGAVRFPDALIRGLSSLFSFAALGIGCLWMLQDPEKQMWHDKIAGTHVVKVPKNLLLG